ncbi:type I restriction-modification enzyme R subunit C-terminal domain-containing protein, partial [Lyngbya sp. CCY1209]|uniref:type I restriction-modification enzyme R subunit C-terminal domain-containing protein n=1 Tax=Lyngbya sp. CCY1209 TaxID=2886103 RepID=UPI002D20BDC2
MNDRTRERVEAIAGCSTEEMVDYIKNNSAKERVDRAIAKVLASRQWTDSQRKWLERIGKQLKSETVVDRL